MFQFAVSIESANELTRNAQSGKRMFSKNQLYTLNLQSIADNTRDLKRFSSTVEWTKTNNKSMWKMSTSVSPLSIEWFGKRTGRSVDIGARIKSTVKKLGRERRPVVSQKWLSSRCNEPSPSYLFLNILTSALLLSPSPLNFGFYRPLYLVWELCNKRKQKMIIDTVSKLLICTNPHGRWNFEIILF